MRENKKGFWIILFLVFALFGTLFLVQYQQELRRRAAYGTANVDLLPSVREVEVGDTFNLRLQVTPGMLGVRLAPNLVKINLSFDQQIVELVDVEFTNNFTGTFTLKEDKVEILALTTMRREELMDLTAQQSFSVAELIFRAIDEGNTGVVRVGDYAITGSRGIGGPDVDRAIELSDFGNARVMVGEGELVPAPPEGWPELTFQITFGGTRYLVGGQERIVDDIGTQPVDVTIRGNGISQKYERVMVDFDDQAVGTGTLELVGVEPGDNYAVLIKGPVHLARRFCHNNQTERCWLGDESITLVAGENVFDWTGLELEPGDIDGNGVINSADFSLLKNALGKRGRVKEDINFNGIVNTQDIAIFLKTLSTKYEDEI